MSDAPRDSDDEVRLGRREAAWLAQITENNITAWINEGSLAATRTKGTPPIRWADLKATCEKKHRLPPLRPEWLTVTAADPLPSAWRETNTPSEDGATARPLDDEIGPSRETRRRVEELTQQINQLQAALATAALERDFARQDAQNLDQAAMAYRDNWRRHSEPATPEPLG
jgi:hypothetical protein